MVLKVKELFGWFDLVLVYEIIDIADSTEQKRTVFGQKNYVCRKTFLKCFTKHFLWKKVVEMSNCGISRLRKCSFAKKSGCGTVRLLKWFCRKLWLQKWFYTNDGCKNLVVQVIYTYIQGVSKYNVIIAVSAIRQDNQVISPTCPC